MGQADWQYLTRKEPNWADTPIVYCARSLCEPDRVYDTTFHKCPTVLWAAWPLLLYLHGYQYTVHADHQAHWVDFEFSSFNRRSRTLLNTGIGIRIWNCPPCSEEKPNSGRAVAAGNGEIRGQPFRRRYLGACRHQCWSHQKTYCEGSIHRGLWRCSNGGSVNLLKLYAYATSTIDKNCTPHTLTIGHTRASERLMLTWKSRLTWGCLDRSTKTTEMDSFCYQLRLT